MTYDASTAIYVFSYPYYERDVDDPQSRELPPRGTLEDAIEVARAEGVTVRLSDEAGFHRGVVHPAGDYTLL